MVRAAALDARPAARPHAPAAAEGPREAPGRRARDARVPRGRRRLAHDGHFLRRRPLRILHTPPRRPRARRRGDRAPRRRRGPPLAVDPRTRREGAPRVEAARDPPGDGPHGPRGRAAALRRRVVQPRREASERSEPRDHAALELGDAQGDGRREVGARHGGQPPRPARRPSDGRHAPALVLDLACGLARSDRRGRGVRPGGRAFPARGRADSEARVRAQGPPRLGRRGADPGDHVVARRSISDGLRRRARPPRALQRQGIARGGDHAPLADSRRRELRAGPGRARARVSLFLRPHKGRELRPSRAEGGPAGERDRSQPPRSAGHSGSGPDRRGSERRSRGRDPEGAREGRPIRPRPSRARDGPPEVAGSGRERSRPPSASWSSAPRGGSASTGWAASTS